MYNIDYCTQKYELIINYLTYVMTHNDHENNCITVKLYNICIGIVYNLGIFL